MAIGLSTFQMSPTNKWPRLCDISGQGICQRDVSDISRYPLHQVELSAQDSNRSRSRKYLGIGPATEQDWPNCGQQEETCPKRQLGDQTKNERSTMACQEQEKTGVERAIPQLRTVSRPGVNLS